MYTGIIQTLGRVYEANMKANLLNFKVEVDAAKLDNIFVGASCAIDGVCFTVVSIENNCLEFDSIKQTLDNTTIGDLKIGDLVHFERSAKYGDENGGHNISGHVHTKVELVRLLNEKNNHTLVFKTDSDWIKYIFDKGYISLQGASLTVSFVNVSECEFGVSLIPETLRQTNFGKLNIGDYQNIEVEQQTKTIVDVVERTLDRKKWLVQKVDSR